MERRRHFAERLRALGRRFEAGRALRQIPGRRHGGGQPETTGGGAERAGYDRAWQGVRAWPGRHGAGDIAVRRSPHGGAPRRFSEGRCVGQRRGRGRCEDGRGRFPHAGRWWRSRPCLRLVIGTAVRAMAAADRHSALGFRRRDRPQHPPRAFRRRRAGAARGRHCCVVRKPAVCAPDPPACRDSCCRSSAFRWPTSGTCRPISPNSTISRRR